MLHVQTISKCAYDKLAQNNLSGRPFPKHRQSLFLSPYWGLGDIVIWDARTVEPTLRSIFYVKSLVPIEYMREPTDALNYTSHTYMVATRKYHFSVYIVHYIQITLL